MTTDEPPIYVRRAPDDDHLRLFLRYRRRRRYDVRQEGRPDRRLSFSTLDGLLDGRRHPADFWQAVHAADAAFTSGDRRTWFDVRTGGGRVFVG